MTLVHKSTHATRGEATALVLANLGAWSAGGEVAIAYLDAPDAVTVVVERVSDVAIALRRGPLRKAA